MVQMDENVLIIRFAILDAADPSRSTQQIIQRVVLSSEAHHLGAFAFQIANVTLNTAAEVIVFARFVLYF